MLRVVLEQEGDIEHHPWAALELCLGQLAKDPLTDEGMNPAFEQIAGLGICKDPGGE